MIALTQIEEYGRQIGREFHPDRVLLFGSYACGTPTPDSDVDILVIMPFEGTPARQAVNIRLKLSVPFPMDLLVRTPEKVRARIDMGDCFMQEIMERGKVLYERDDQRLDC